MEEMIMKKGFQKTDFPNEYVKNNWTIRLDKDSIEAFNDPDKAAGKYYIYPIFKVDLEQLLDEIEELI